MYKEKLYKEYIELCERYENKVRSANEQEKEKLEIEKKYEEEKQRIFEENRISINSRNDSINRLQKEIDKLNSNYMESSALNLNAKDIIKEMDLLEREIQDLQNSKSTEINKFKKKEDANNNDIVLEKRDIDNLKAQIANIDLKYKEILDADIKYCEKDANFSTKYNSLIKNEVNPFPNNVSDEKLIKDLIQRKNIHNKQDILLIAKNTIMIDEINIEWLKTLTVVIIPILFSVISLGILCFSKVHFGFTQAIASMLFGLVNGLIIGLFDFVIISLIIFLISRKKALSLGCGTIVFILSVVWAIAQAIGSNVYLIVKYNDTSIVVIEYIIKILISASIGGIVLYINSKTLVGDNIIKAIKNIKFVNNRLLKNNLIYQNNLVNYSVILKYVELLSFLNNISKAKDLELLKNKLSISNNKLNEMLNKHYDKEIADYVVDIDSRIKKKESALEQKRNELTVEKNLLIEKLRIDIENHNKTNIKEQSKNDEKIGILESKFKDNIAEYKKNIEKNDNELRNLLNDINDRYDGLKSEIEYTEQNGVLSDYLYIENENNGKDKYIKIIEIPFNKKPIIVLHNIKNDNDKIKILDSYIEKITLSFFNNNALEIFDITIYDPIYGGTTFNERDKKLDNIYINSDIDVLSQEINCNIQKASLKTTKIDKYNKDMVKNGEDLKHLIKYNIVEFIIPSDVNNTKCNVINDIMIKNLRSREFGFIPIFYINIDDWEKKVDDYKKVLGFKENDIIKLFIDTSKQLIKIR